MKKYEKIDVDYCDRKEFCYIHEKYKYIQYDINKEHMENIILQRIKNQKEIFLSEKNMNYLNHLKDKFKSNS